MSKIQAVAQGELNNALTFLGVVGEEGEPSLKTLSLKFYVDTGSPAAEVERVWQAALKRSPLYTTLHSAVDIQTELQISY